MNYIKSTEKVCENDIILTHKYRGDEDRLAIVNSIDEENQLICCTLIESTKVVYSKVFKCTLVKHATEAEARKYVELVNRIAKANHDKYTNLEYIRDNIEFKNVINKTSVEFLAERARIDRKDIKYWEHLHEGIKLAVVYTNPMMYKCMLVWGFDYDDAEIDDLMAIHSLFN